MLSWLKRLFARGESRRPVDLPAADHAEPSRACDMRAALESAAETAWWKDKTGLVSKTDEQLVVIAPRSDATQDDLRSLGKALTEWKAARPFARHIWGLEDLLEGKRPRTPPIYLSVPFLLDRFHECYEPVCLVYVAAGTDLESAGKDLYAHLSGLQDKLAWFEHPDAYSYYQR